MKEKNLSHEKFLARRILFHFILFFVITVAIAISGLLIVQSVQEFTVKILLAVLFLLLNVAVLTLLLRLTVKTVKAKLDVFIGNNAYYESVLDAVPFPIHVIDDNMKWTYMNKAFENLLIQNGAIKNRTSAYGLSCSTASANICNTEQCGIRQLREKGKAETYFDWFDLKCKQDTSVIKDRLNHVTGYVEVVSDLTSLLKVNEYSKDEIARLSENLDKIANGILNVNIEVTPADEYTEEIHDLFLKINNSLVKVCGSINSMADQANTLVQAGLDGDLDVRGDTSKVNGVFAQIIDGVNKTFDSFKAPLDAASVFISDLAQGTASVPLAHTYKGYYGKLTDNLNAVLAALVILHTESQKLAEAGQNGRLEVRGNLSAVNGAYADIISGFNKTLDSVVTPLKESSEILSKFAYNDYTSEMTGTYQGTFKDFAESINMVKDRLLSVQDAIVKLGEGDVSRLEEFKKVGKRSENDQIMPAVTTAYQTIQDLIDDSNDLATAAYEGRLDLRGNTDQFSGGYRQIIEGMNRTMEAVATPIEESSRVLQEVARGDLTVAMVGEYKGSYNLIKDGLNHAISSFNDLLSEISIAAEQVALGSKQVSDGSQSLSQGTTEQASSIEELTSSITEISTETKQNAQNATQASSLASITQTEAAQGTEKMNQMLVSMKEINESSANISKINKVIDDIAFQTNILALNAAVEAARAGQYGKGFAVVAEEVRNLAAKSAQAANETTALIESSIVKVENGTRIASETANTLTKISESVQKVNLIVGNIASASNDQATAISQIDQGLSQVSIVIQTNSATAEESAASSEELSGQADMLKEVVQKFRLV